MKPCKKKDILCTNCYFILIFSYPPVFVLRVRTTRCLHMISNNINLEENEERTGLLLKKALFSGVIDCLEEWNSVAE